jgi:hypothetical protein
MPKAGTQLNGTVSKRAAGLRTTQSVSTESQTFFVTAVSSRTIRIGDYLPGKKTTLAK